jgi:hypothetical protein
VSVFTRAAIMPANKMGSPIPPIIAAASRGDLAGVKAALQSGADVNTLDAGGMTALHMAACNDHVRVIEALLDAGADPRMAGAVGKTALHFAGRQLQPEIVRLLLDAGAEVDATDRHGNTPLFDAMFATQDDPMTMRLLLAAGADERRKNEHGVSPLSFARTVDHPNLLAWLKAAPRPSRPVAARPPSTAGPRTPKTKKKTTKKPTGYAEEARRIWKTYVPARGQADTVQGELLRAVEKLRDEAQRNGDGNWDAGHEILARFVRDTLIDSALFDPDQRAEITRAVDRLLDYDRPELRDSVYDLLAERVVDWCRKHPEPVPHRRNPKLRR